MPTNRRVRSRAKQHPTTIPWGVYTFLLGLTYQPSNEPDGRLEVFRREPAELLDLYWPRFTPEEQRRALKFAQAVARGEASYWAR